MKKLVSLILALCIVAGTVPSFFAGAKNIDPGEVVSEQPLFRIGIMSDHQMNNTTGENAQALVAAMQDFADRGVDAIIEAGDIADSNPETIYTFYKQKYSEIIGDDVPLISVPGNHDVWSDNSLNIYRSYFGEPNKHVVVGGYHFVVISSNGNLGTATNGNYGAAEKNFARTELAVAAADTPAGQPIFVITHQHIKNTVYGSGPDANWANDFLWGIIDNYPNAVHFSGHSHFVLEDERSIWQGDFTAVGTSSMAYTELEYGKDNGSVPPNASEAKQYLYLTIYSDRIEIERIKAATGKKIKDNWVLDLPLQKSTFKYTDARANDRTAPYFNEGAAVEAEMVNSDLTFTFDAAKHDDFVHSYRLRLYKNGGSSPVKDILIFSDFYRGLENMSKTVSYKLEGVAEEYAAYRLEITPIESFGKTGEPLVYEFASVKALNIQPMTRGKLFTADFATGEARNAVSSLEIKRSGGSVEKLNGKYVYIPSDGARLSVSMSNAFYSLTTLKFSLEAAFITNGFGSVQTLASCYSNGGVKLWISEDGKLCAAAFNSNKESVELASECVVPLREVCTAALTFESSTLKLWLNGEQVASLATTKKLTYNTTAKYAIGSMSNGSNPLNGAILTASLDSSIPSAEQIKTLYDSLSDCYDVKIMLPVLEQQRRSELLSAANPDNVVMQKILGYYNAEINALADSVYITSEIISKAIAYRDLDADVANTGATALPSYTQPAIGGVAHGDRYDVSAGEAPAPTFTNAETVLLDGEPYAEGSPIGEGKHTLLAYNGWRMDGVQFEVYDSTYFAPVIYGVEDGKTYDVTKEEAPAITWEPAELTAQLDNQPYAAGTPVTADGWHVFMLSDGKTTLVYAFKIEHSVKGDLDG
ncbi:MAG: metallophosphoesterase, partial [Clostridia bacterium]|nr:metallophosphoesterase [Clostridia bacterium]